MGNKIKRPAKLPASWAPLPVKISNRHEGRCLHSGEVNVVLLHRFHQDLYEIYKLSEFIRVDEEVIRSTEKD